MSDLSPLSGKADIGTAARGPVVRSNLAGAMFLVRRADARATGGPGDWERITNGCQRHPPHKVHGAAPAQRDDSMPS
jgi:hypothetical protein